MIIIFDFDGTIADSTYKQLEIAREVLSKFGYNIPSEKYEVYYKLFREKGPFPVLLRIGFPIFKYPKLLAEIKKCQTKSINTFHPVEGMDDVVRIISKSYECGIISAGYRKYINPFLKKFRLTTYFRFLVTDDRDAGKEKIFGKFMKESRINPDEIVYVGDEEIDLKITHKLGIKFIAVSWGVLSAGSWKRKKVKFLAKKPNDLVEIIEKLLVKG